MNKFIENHATAMFEGVVTGVVVLMLNAIGHEGFGTPELPFVYGLALILAIIVAAIRSMTHPQDETHR